MFSKLLLALLPSCGLRSPWDSPESWPSKMNVTGHPLPELSAEQERFAVLFAFAAAHAQRHWFAVDVSGREDQHIGVGLGPSRTWNIVTLAGLALHLLAVQPSRGF